MLDAVNKFGRALARDYLPVRQPGCEKWTYARQWTLYAALGVATIAGGLFWHIPLVAFVGGSFSTGAILREIQERHNEMRSREEGAMTPPFAGAGSISLRGPGRDICIVENTQKLVEKMTKGLEAEAELPAPVAAKLAPYLGDGAAAAAQLTARDNDREIDDIALLRATKDAAQEGVSVVALLPTKQGIEKRARDAFRTAVVKTAEAFHEGLSRALPVRRIHLKTPGGNA